MPNGTISTTKDFTNGELINVGTADMTYAQAENTLSLLFAYAKKDPALLGYWRFEETTGTVAADETDDHPGTIENGVTLDQPGVFDRCFEFDGNNDDINLGAAISALVQSLTLAVWIKVTSTSGSLTRRIAGNRGSGGSGNGWELVLNKNTDGSTLLFQTSPSTGDSSFALGATDLRDGEWHLVCATYDYLTGKSKVYIDGIDDTDESLDGIGDISNALNTYLGRTYQFGYFKEYMDEPKIYSRALDGGEIEDLYNDGYQYDPSGNWKSPNSASELFGSNYKETDDEFDAITLNIAGGSGSTYVDKVEIWDADRKTLVTTATGPFSTNVTLEDSDFDNGLDETDVNCNIKLYLVGDTTTRVFVESIAWSSFTPEPPAPPTPTDEPIERWRLLMKDGVTEDEDLYDAIIYTNLDRFAKRGTVYLLDFDGTKPLTYQKAYPVTLQVHPEGLGIFHNLLSGFIMDHELDTDITQLSILSHDLWLKKRDVFKSYVGTKISSVLIDLISDYTPLLWNTGLVEIVNDVEVTRIWKGERLDEVIKELASMSGDEEFGATDDMKFFFRPREIVQASQNFLDGDYDKAVFPKKDRQQLNKVRVFYGEGDNKKSITVQNLDDQQEITDQIDAPRPTVIEASKHYPEIDNEDAARRKGQSFLDGSEKPLTGTLHTWGGFDLQPGQVTFVEAPDQNVNDSFRIAEVQWRLLNGDTKVVVVQNDDGVLETLTQLTNDVVRVDVRDTDIEATETEVIGVAQQYKIVKSIRVWKMTVPETMFIAGEKKGNVGDPNVGGGLVGDQRGPKEEIVL